MARQIWKIYRLTFPDGKVYVGQTSQKLETRLTQHKKDYRGRPVGMYLRRGWVPKVEVLDQAVTQVEADHLETLAIKKIPPGSSLNQSHPGPTGFRENTTNLFKCSTCGNSYPATQMSPDKRKTSGCASRCQICYRSYSRLAKFLKQHHTIPQDKVYKVAYRVARGLRAAGVVEDGLRWKVFRGFDWGVLEKVETWQQVERMVKNGHPSMADLQTFIP